eukprot:2191916-Lingulodinium_polyedra.AAC.1
MASLTRQSRRWLGRSVPARPSSSQPRSSPCSSLSSTTRTGKPMRRSSATTARTATATRSGTTLKARKLSTYSECNT